MELKQRNHKSIKDNNNTNFQKLPDNFNFKLNRIQTVKLKVFKKVTMIKHSIQMMKEQKIESFKKNKENIIDNDILSELKKHFDVQN